MPSITITVSIVQYLAGSTVIVGLIMAGYWCGRADRRDGRVLGGIRENDAAFAHVRAVRERSKQRVVDALATLRAVSQPVEEATKPRWVPAGAAYVVDEDVPPARDEDREVDPDDDGYPHGMRADFGAMRLPVEVPRGDADMSGWRVNPPYEPQRPVPGAHRAEPDPEQHQTRDLAAFVGVASPPGVSA